VDIESNLPPEHKQYTKVYGTHLRETEKAVQFAIAKIDDTPTTHLIKWFPLSQVKSIQHSSPASPDFDMMEVATWILEKEDLL
jgi:hypothetical protein